MIRYVIRRLLQTIPILLGVSLIVFIIMAMTPGDPGRLILGTTAPEEAVIRLNEQLGYYKPYQSFERYRFQGVLSRRSGVNDRPVYSFKTKLTAPDIPGPLFCGVFAPQIL